MIIQGTTPKQRINVPLNVENISKIEIVYAQDDKIIFTKSLDDCQVDEKGLSFKLTQEETFSFDHKKLVQIQVRVLSNSGDVVGSLIEHTSVAECLSDEVL
jgi:hypothetical protein